MAISVFNIIDFTRDLNNYDPPVHEYVMYVRATQYNVLHNTKGNLFIFRIYFNRRGNCIYDVAQVRCSKQS